MNQKSHLWSGRFAEAPDTEVFDFQASFGFDNQLFEDDVEGSLAWAEALASAGVLTRDDAVVIRQALIEIREDARLDPDFLTGSDEDVHAFVERQLIARVGDVGRRLHTGRSRNEQVSLDLRLYLRRRLLVVQDKIVNFVAALAARAESAGHAVMPAYTHLRRAQPVLVAHFFLAHAVAFRRDYGRLNTARDEADALPMGSGAVVGTSYDINPEALAARLGFSRVVANSVDAAVSDATLPHQWQESDVSAAIVSAIHVGVGCFRNETKPVHFEQLWQIVVVFASEVERRLLRVFL